MSTKIIRRYSKEEKLISNRRTIDMLNKYLSSIQISNCLLKDKHLRMLEQTLVLNSDLSHLSFCLIKNREGDGISQKVENKQTGKFELKEQYICYCQSNWITYYRNEFEFSWQVNELLNKFQAERYEELEDGVSIDRLHDYRYLNSGKTIGKLVYRNCYRKGDKGRFILLLDNNLSI
ncbi:hypothetical protein H6G33_10490 [Calothrix sp. FACHB-1219]|uniref:hypothetical protein n=1 Tax=unclassified Calothrix TaxID=2619626 RepID=UPI001689628A|nr:MULTISPECIES: hypothetical protein [unclassified Calothrix]MBD2201775.1 hypothetical protein [Calothrix sp. FACHB-168]MBD2217461.1 hypothetical protein [Calothrix sp. FACHB-1219]